MERSRCQTGWPWFLITPAFPLERLEISSSEVWFATYLQAIVPDFIRHLIILASRGNCLKAMIPV